MFVIKDGRQAGDPQGAARPHGLALGGARRLLVMLCFVYVCIYIYMYMYMYMYMYIYIYIYIYIDDQHYDYCDCSTTATRVLGPNGYLVVCSRKPF